MGKSGSLIFLCLDGHPDHFQNVMGSKCDQDLSSHFFSRSSNHQYLRNPANKQANKPTSRQTKGHEFNASLAMVNLLKYLP